MPDIMTMPCLDAWYIAALAPLFAGGFALLSLIPLTAC